ncbi:poly(A) polymerase type 3-like [Epinephelus moara]|uniref:poly(A) polymerase type 3-like n=1 Tax=Epinephelus moara TaxID=300413 RepID=UPI00214F5789|nr:poly(A) polymerase type 3-like [Epinephelus moara]
MSREKVVKNLESFYKEWLQEICEQMNVPETVTAHVGGNLIPFGSYHLGVHSKGADIDVLCVGPSFLERKDFFTSFFQKLKAQEEVNNIQAVEEATVPVIKSSYEGIEVICSEKKYKLSCVQYPSLRFVCMCLDHCYRVTEEILRAVPNVHNFRLTLRAIRLWAKRRNIYSSALGFLGGVSWAIILVARICQLYSNSTASTLVTKFFLAYSIRASSSVQDVVVVLIHPSDRYHLMPILTPSYPVQNSAVNVSHSTVAIMSEEFKRETSPKEFKSDEEPVKGTCSQPSAGVTPGVSLSQSPSQSARGTKRPHTPKPKTPSEKAKLDLVSKTVSEDVQLTCTIDPIQPATTVRRAIKLHLIRRN